MKRAIFFDLDGTLWDALIPLTDAWNLAMEKSNLPYRFDVKTMQSYMGLLPEETVPLAFPDVDMESGLKLFKITLDAEIEYLAKQPGKLYKNEEKVICSLSKKYPLYIISNADKGYVENYLNACNMGKYYSGHFNAGDTGMPKWKNILLMKEKENIDEVIYVGDTLKDKEESEKAGVRFIHARYGFGKIENDKNYIDSLEELPNKIEEMFNK